MDIVEAVKRLKEARTTIQPYKYVDEAIDYIVETLEQEPCDDAINRQAVLEIIRDFEYKNSHEEMLINSRIKQLPSVTPAEKVGHWIVHPKGIYAHLVCSNCLTRAPYDCETNYCPKCGRKMEVEE